MIQELFGERKISIIDGGILESIPPQPNSLTSSPPNSSTIITPISTPTTTTSSNNSENQQNQNQSQNQNLRCPRCDSSNTKFCYYNNYNLTQPRHFCKTCRRYWTKGGALRNVPIGGGCRKNRSGLSHVLTTALGKSTTSPTAISTKAGKMKIFSSLDHEINGQSGLDHLELSSSSGAASQVLWGSPQNSHILALLRATQNPNSNTNPFIGGTHMGTEPMCAPGAFNGQNNIMGLEPLISQVPSLWRNINNQFQAHHNQQQGERNNGFSGNDAGQNNGIHELYQRLRSSSMNCFTDHHHPAVVLSSNVGSTTTSRSFVLESSAAAPLGGGHHELGGYNWNPAFSCPSDFAATNGTAYP